MSSNSPDPSTPVSDSSTGVSTTSASPDSSSCDAGGESGRIRIGTQRADKLRTIPDAPKPNPAMPLVSKAPVERRETKYPAPNMRDKLTPELEFELAEALGGMPLDDIIAGVGAKTESAELEPETRVSGPVVKVHRENVFVDLGGRREGVISLKSFAAPPEPGQVLNAMVSRFNPTEGLYELVLSGAAVQVADWSEVNEGMVVEARVTGHNKGGLECEVNKLRGFIPASQVSLYRVEDLSQFVDQKFACVITEANQSKGNLVLSRRAVLEREKAEAKTNLLGQLEVGQLREATVRSLQNFGAFVDLGGIDGSIHISQLSWDRIKHADEVLEVGQKVKVKIQKIDPATGKIGLAFRDLAENPWSGVAQKYPTRSRVKGTVSRITEFGAFVRLEPGIEGLVHISELSHKRVWRASDIVQEGQEVEVQVMSVDTEQQRIGLSIKALEARAVTKPVEEEAPEEEVVAPIVSKRKTPLKGGAGNASGGGEKFGLKW